ncbi:hypothetical protein BH20CHL1_BH20CHL1_06830 [soil metagenome]
MYSSTSKSAHREGETTQGSSWFRELYGYFASARQEILECGHTEEEISTRLTRPSQLCVNAMKTGLDTVHGCLLTFFRQD